MDELPKIIVHRGGAIIGPENTMAALELAASQGAQWVETDVRLTKDGRAVLIHDDSVDRTTSGSGKLSDFTLTELQSLDAGSWHCPSFSGARVPTLDQWVAFCAKRHIGINLEIKEKSRNTKRVAECIVDTLKAHWGNELPVPLISSKHMGVLRGIRERLPDLRYGWVGERYPFFWRIRLKRIGGVVLVLNHLKLTPKRILPMKKAGCLVLGYTVNNRHRAELLFKMGVDAVFSDDPSLLG